MLQEAFSKIIRVFDEKTLIQGQALFDHERVLSTRLSDGLLRGKVKGLNNQIYDVYMDLKRWPETPATCSCSNIKNCEHAAACLMYLHGKDIHAQSVRSLSQNLDDKLNTWLKNLQREDKRLKEEKTHVLLYLIKPKYGMSQDVIRIHLAIAKILKRGGLGQKIILSSISEGKKKFLMPEDEEIIAKLMFKSSHYGFIQNLETNNSALLEKILATKRVYSAQDQDEIITLGEECIPTCSWDLAMDGKQYFTIKQNTHPIRPLLLDKPWYYDEENQILGKLNSPFPSTQLINLLDAPPVDLDQASVLAKRLEKIAPEIPRPQVYTEIQTRVEEPKVQLILRTFPLPWGKLMYYADLEFLYGNTWVNYDIDLDNILVAENNHLIEYQRNFEFEEAIHEFVDNLVPIIDEEASEEVYPRIFLGYEDTDKHYLYETFIPALKKAGHIVNIQSPHYQEQFKAEDFEWYSDLEETDKDFFSYQLGILVEGKPVSIVPLVAELIGKYRKNTLDTVPDDETVSLTIESGKALLLPMQRIKPLLRLLLQFGSQAIDQDHQLKINRYQLMLLKEIELATAATKARWQGAETLRTQLQQLVVMENIPWIASPQGLKAQLRDYQHHGLNWLVFLKQCRFGGILADDMGLGKTVQALALLQHEKEEGRLQQASLIVAPTSLVGNWQAEAARFTPHLKVLVFHGTERHLENDFNEYDLIVSTYGLIQRDKSRFLDYHFYYLILDEAQFIKNARTKTTQIIQQIQASYRLCLTGTPMENHLGELWSLFHFLMPGLLGDSKQFRQWFRNPIEKNGDLTRRELLIKRVQPFMLRRTKNEVVKELPPKTEMLIKIDLVEKQRDLYEAIRMRMEKKVMEAIARQGLGKSHIVLLDALLKLRQVCCDPRLLSLSEAHMAHGYSAKLDTFMELLDNLMEEGRRVLVFSQFTSMLSLIEQALKAKKYTWLKLTGETQNRQALVEKFQQGEAPIFLISLKAGGTGLNLTKADTVIHYDPWWNPAVEDQATDRSHRIGQENPVFVYKLITAGTVEEAILKMQSKKRQLFEGVVSAEMKSSMMLTESDIESFFTPLE